MKTEMQVVVQWATNYVLVLILINIAAWNQNPYSMGNKLRLIRVLRHVKNLCSIFICFWKQYFWLGKSIDVIAFTQSKVYCLQKQTKMKQKLS